MRLYLEDLHNSASQYFPNDQYMLQNHAWLWEPFKVQNGPVDFRTIRQETVIAMASDCTAEVTVRKLSVAGLGITSEECSEWSGTVTEVFRIHVTENTAQRQKKKQKADFFQACH